MMTIDFFIGAFVGLAIGNVFHYGAAIIRDGLARKRLEAYREFKGREPLFQLSFAKQQKTTKNNE